MHRIGPALLAIALLAWAIVAVRCAWMSDDAFITMRHLEHLCAGYGLRYNVAERVQAFTHPLWALLLLPGHALFRDPYYPPLFLSLFTGTAAIALAALRAAPSHLAGAALVVLLTGSKAVVDFTTSGLENPLTHLLVVAFAVEFLRKQRLPVLALLTGLAMTNRLDTVVLLAPALAFATYRDRTQLVPALIAGAVPLMLWHSFALVYYGFPFPNTAYAKLGAGIPRSELITSGGQWLDWAIRTDPTTIVLLILGLISARTAPLRALAVGALLYVLYVVSIGGDFMGDRFLSAPAVLLAIPLVHLPGRLLAAATALCVVLSIVMPASPWRSGADYGKAEARNGIVDERGYYWKGAGWLSTTPGTRPVHRFAKTGARVGKRGQDHVLKATAGFVGYYAGPDTHVVDPLGLTDPLLARLPAEFDPNWRVGHFRRFVPPGYVQTAGTDAVDLHDPDLNRYYAALRTVTQGPLFTAERWSTIVALNTGQLSALIDTDHYRYPHLKPVDSLPVRAPAGGISLHVTGPTLLRLEQVPGAQTNTPWTARFDNRGPPLQTRQLRPGDHTLVPPRGATRLLLFPSAPARVSLPESD